MRPVARRPFFVDIEGSFRRKPEARRQHRSHRWLCRPSTLSFFGADCRSEAVPVHNLRWPHQIMVPEAKFVGRL
jgi:hypothetical protein